jgi:ribosome-binding protein aMBF1 (putative translation factor)
MSHTRIFDNHGTDLMEFFARQREQYSPEELVRYEVSIAIYEFTIVAEMARRELGLTQEELAARCGFKSRIISGFENYDVLPPFDKVVRIFYELGLELTVSKRRIEGS